MTSCHDGCNYDNQRHEWQGAKHRPAIFFFKIIVKSNLISYTVHMKTVNKQSTPTKTIRRPSPWEKAAGLLKIKKTAVLKELSQSRKGWVIKRK